MHKKNMEYVVAHGTPEQMHQMQEVLVQAVCKLKELSPTEYNNVEYCLHKVAHGGELGEDLAKSWVAQMKNKDGTTGAHWTWDQVAQLQKEKRIGKDVGTVYALLNMMYSDYYNPKFDLNIYIEMVKDWLNDPDVGECKTLKYYYFVVH